MTSDPGTQGVPSLRFDCATEPAPHRFESRAREVAPLFDVSPAGNIGGFDGAIEAHLLDGMVVARSRFSAQAYRRNRGLVARSSLDAYLVQLYTAGGFDGQADNTELSVGRGDICVFDLTATLATRARKSAAVSLVIPKAVIDGRWSARVPVHGLMVPGSSALGQLMGSHLASLAKAMPQVAASEAPLVANTTVQMVANCFAHGVIARGGRARDIHEGASRDLLYHRALHYISSNLGSLHLSPSAVASALRVSRSHLYSAFHDRGGIARCIQQQRLRAALAELTNPLHRAESVASIAFRCGFVSPSHFSRAFYAVYGLRPGDVRDTNPVVAGIDGRPTLPAWLSHAIFRAP